MKNFLTPEEIRQLTPSSGPVSTLAIFFDWAIILLSFWLVINFAYWPVWLICFVTIARQQLALALLMHDGAHRLLYQKSKTNDFICQFFCAAPLFFSMFSYRKLHFKHHKVPLAEDDPDISLIGGYPVSKRSFARKLLRDLTGFSYFKFIRYFIHMARKKKTENDSASIRKTPAIRPTMPVSVLVFSILLMNGLIFSFLFAMGHPWYYFFFWFLPTATALQFLLRIRGVAEHAGFTVHEDQRFNSRTVKKSWQTLLFAPHNANYHLEHHIYPGIPCFRLPQVHKLMLSKGSIPQGQFYKGYGEVLKEILQT